MATLVDQESRVVPTGRFISRGFAAAHGAILDALYLALLYAPLQVVGAVLQGHQGGKMFGAEQQPDTNQVILSLTLAGISLVVALAVFFLFPFVQGGILGQVRDRLNPPDHVPGRLGTYGRVFYVRLLGSQGLFVLVLIPVMIMVMCLGADLAIQQVTSAMSTESPVPPSPQQLDRQLLAQPVMLVAMVIASLLVSAVGMVYWVANSIVVAEHEPVLASWRKSLHFCRENFSAVLLVWLLNVVAGLLMTSLSLVGRLGIVTEPWLLVVLALVYSAVIGYWAVALAGLSMSLYLTHRRSTEQLEPGLWRQ